LTVPEITIAIASTAMMLTTIVITIAITTGIEITMITIGIAGRKKACS
jgi:hypothetical protein